jgi:hypothetical protein
LLHVLKLFFSRSDLFDFGVYIEVQNMFNTFSKNERSLIKMSALTFPHAVWLNSEVDAYNDRERPYAAVYVDVNVSKRYNYGRKSPVY